MMMTNVEENASRTCDTLMAAAAAAAAVEAHRGAHL